MPSLVDLPALLEEIEARLTTTLPDLLKVYFGKPRTENLLRPYGCVIAEPVDNLSRTVSTFEQKYRVQIFLVYDLPADKDKPTLLAQEEIQGLVVPALETGPIFAGVAESPVVENIAFDQGQEDDGKDVMVVILTLGMTCEQPHGV